MEKSLEVQLRKDTNKFWNYVPIELQMLLPETVITFLLFFTLFQREREKALLSPHYPLSYSLLQIPVSLGVYLPILVQNGISQGQEMTINHSAAF